MLLLQLNICVNCKTHYTHTHTHIQYMYCWVWSVHLYNVYYSLFHGNAYTKHTYVYTYIL